MIVKNKNRKPTMADVARRAGVSAMTVSRALKGKGSVTEETRGKIMCAVDELGYVLDLAAGSLSSQKTGFISVVIPSINNSNFAETVRGITESLDRAGKQILLGYTYELEREEQLVQAMLQRRPEGIILTGGQHTVRTRQLLDNSTVPVIEMWDLPTQPINHVVGASNEAMVEDMVARLVFKGYRNIAFIGGDEESEDFRGIDRRRGYERAIETLKLPKAHIVPLGKPPITIRHGGPAVVRLLQEWPEVEAVICVSDLCAVGVIMECHRNNWAVPGRLGVAGFGHFEISRHSWPTITTVSLNCPEIGRQAGKLMLEAIEAGATETPYKPRKITIPHSIIERDST